MWCFVKNLSCGSQILVTIIWELGFVIQIQSGHIKRTWVGHTIWVSFFFLLAWQEVDNGIHSGWAQGSLTGKWLVTPALKLKDFCGWFSIYLLNPPWILNSAGNMFAHFQNRGQNSSNIFGACGPPDPNEGHKPKDFFLFSSRRVGEVQSTRNLPLVFKHTNRTFSIPPHSRLEGNFEQLINGKQHFCSAAKHNIHTWVFQLRDLYLSNFVSQLNQSYWIGCVSAHRAC